MIRGGLIPSFFYAKILKREWYFMDRDKLKLIVRNLELLIDSLKAEIYSDTSAYTPKEPMRKKPILDYDEIFEDSDLDD